MCNDNPVVMKCIGYSKCDGFRTDMKDSCFYQTNDSSQRCYIDGGPRPKKGDKSLGMTMNRCIGFQSCANYSKGSIYSSMQGICKYWRIGSSQGYVDGTCDHPLGPKPKIEQDCTWGAYKDMKKDNYRDEDGFQVMPEIRETGGRGKILDQAKEIINGNREQIYGPPEDSFQVIADLWNVYFEHGVGSELGPKDVAMMMCLLKIARQMHQGSEDCLVDLAGYAALAADMS